MPLRLSTKNSSEDNDMGIRNNNFERTPKIIDRFVEVVYHLRRRYALVGYVMPAMILLIGVIIYPMIYSIKISLFQTLSGMESSFVGLSNFVEVLQDPYFSQSLVNTLIYTGITVPVSFVVGLIVASLVQSIPRGRAFFRIVFIVPMSMSPMVVALMWRWMFNPLFGLINWAFDLMNLPQQSWLNQVGAAMGVVIFVDVWQWFPLVFLILTGGLAGLPREPIEAARVDGASKFSIFRYITLPMLRPVILVALLLRTIDAFRVFDNIYMLTEGGPGFTTETLSTMIYRTAFWFNNLGKASAAALLMLAGLGVISAVFFKLLYKEVGE